MLFYKIEAYYKYICSTTNEQVEVQVISRRGRSANEQKVYNYFEGSCDELLMRTESPKESLIFLSSLNSKKAIFGAIYKDDPVDICKQLLMYVNGSPITISEIKVTEVTYELLNGLLNNASNNDIISDTNEVLDVFDMECFSYNKPRVNYNEYIIDKVHDKEELRTAAVKILSNETLIPELDRIFMRAGKRVLYHPVHYLISESDKQSRNEIKRILIEALYANNRILTKRFSVADVYSSNYYSSGAIENLYMMNKGGIVVIKYEDNDNEENEYKRYGRDIIIRLCKAAVKYKQEVLTIFELPSEYQKTKEEFYANLGSMTFIELHTDVVFNDQAKEYLLTKAKEYRIRPDKKLYETIKVDRGIRITDLNTIFDVWLDHKIKTVIYPQYQHTETIKESIKNENIRGSAILELNQMIGLTEAKSVIEKALNFYKVQRMYGNMGIKQENPAMHMIFTGNPGTAKTTVARLFAQIMKDNGLLSCGDLYEVGRSDLVGKYVGSTAPLVKERFKVAKGSILFIDEAYSLVDDKDGLYGDEAINTIVQEMENNRDNMVVIFAGYPDKMERFLDKNPGLRSRIAFHVNFDDYSEQELCLITELIAKSKGVKLTDSAISKVREIVADAKLHPDFGNGRYVRNVIEQAIMQQANRLVKMDVNKITKDILMTISEEDIVAPKRKHEEPRKIGFVI